MAKLRRLTWLPVVDQGCCCCSLETCCKIQGWLLAVLHLAGLVTVVVVWTSRCGNAYDGCAPLGVALLAIHLVIAIIGFVVTVMFLVGLYQRRSQLTMPYVAYLHFKLIVGIHFAIYAIQVVPYFTMFLTIPPLVLIIHMLVCANSLRLKIEEVQGGFHDILGQQLT